MEIILKEDIKNLGNAGDIVEVKNGYARNYLIPQKFAVMATPSAKKDHAEIAKQRAHKETRLRDEATQLAAQIVTKEIRIGAKTSTTGKIFGSVNSIQIAEALSKKGFEIDRKNITLVDADNIKQIGTFKAIVKLYKDIKAEIDFEVFAE